MPKHNPSRSGSTPEKSVSTILESITAELDVAMGSAERVRAACVQLRQQLTSPPTPSDIEHICLLIPLLNKRMGSIVKPLFDLFDDLSLTADDPWPLLEGMLAARDRKLVWRALKRLLYLVESGLVSVDLRVARFFAGRVEMEGCPLGEPEWLATVGKIIQQLTLTGPEAHQNPIMALYLQEKDIKQRRMATRLMDLQGEPAPFDLAGEMLGREVYQFLSPYLAFTRATHLDLIHLVPVSGVPPSSLPSLQRAEALCGNRLLREVIAELGWERINFGLDVRKYISVSIGNSFPFMLSSAEASILKTIKEAHSMGECWLFVGHGGVEDEGREVVRDDRPVSRFRSYNLAHSELLAEILSVAPLTREKINRILKLMDRIVSDFIAIFSSYTEECSVLPDQYGELRERIVSELEKANRDFQISAELTRLVQMFDDPKSLGEVQTLHGLKRFLHQRGLHLGFRLVESSRATNRTVNLVTTSPSRILRVARCIRYIAFEPGEGADEITRIPYPVSLVVDAFSRQILHGQEKLPNVKIFCYGNEIHYFLSFVNHPAFLRIDYSPPLKGGMIDLEYYGVSKNELDLHPNLSLDAIQHFFRKLDYDVQVKDTHIHARYDKERALDLGDICEKAEALFRLVSYLMEVDWVIGSLNLNAESRRAVARAWAKFFVLWGVLPLNQLLTKDRQSVLVNIDNGLKGDREVAWSGQEPYRDRFSTLLPPDFFAKLQSFLSELGLAPVSPSEDWGNHTMGQIKIENLILRPLREAVEVGEIIETPYGFHRAAAELFRREHEAERFAEILASGKEAIASSASLAQLVATLEQTLRFQTTGSLNGHDVQFASLPLSGKPLILYVVRDAEDIISLAMFAQGKTISLRREVASLPWRSNGSLDASALAMLLRLNNYITTGMESMYEVDLEKAESIRDRFSQVNPKQRLRPLHGERVLKGLKASPGRAVGKVLFGTERRSPKDFEGSILVTPSLRPEDNVFLYHSSGVISTGGGILSHAGLTAIQFRKPALIISGQWLEFPDGEPMLLYRTSEFREEEKSVHGYRISIRSDIHKRDHRLHEGDLVILDAEEGTLRILGQGRDVLAFHDGFRNFGEATRRLTQTTDKRKVLILRGQRLRSRHRIEKVLARITDPMLAHHVVHELLLNEHLSCAGGRQSEKTQLLSLVLGNQSVGRVSRDYLLQIFDDLKLRNNTHIEELLRKISSAVQPYEILLLRLQMLHLRQTLEVVFTSLRDCGFKTISIDDLISIDIDPTAKGCLRVLRDRLVRDLDAAASSVKVDFRLRHLIRQVERLDLVLKTSPALREPIERLKTRIVQEDKGARDKLKQRRILCSEDCGFELFPLIGWKAANLAEVERLGGRGLTPPWMVITNRVFQKVLDLPPGKTVESQERVDTDKTVRQTIETILLRDDIDNFQKSVKIRQLWDGITLPEVFVEEVVTAYHKLNQDAPEDTLEEDLSGPFVAVRSSSGEEDVEIAARAGEFDTFLFVRGETHLLDHIKRAWSGLWTERAIHNRIVLGMTSEKLGGGVIVQRNAWSRVSGVLQTVNVAEGNPREMVINAGLGLGEGIVSGIVAADQIVVDKEGIWEGKPLRFRYITSDKREHVVFNKRTGLGTVLCQTLYHQRLRPGLEYIKLYELVRIAARLETAYGYPLDIEFGIEGTKLWILQARPVVTFIATLRETLRNYPLSVQDEAPPSSAKEIPL